VAQPGWLTLGFAVHLCLCSVLLLEAKDPLTAKKVSDEIGMSERKRDQHTVQFQALQMYNRQKLLNAQRESNNRSLMVAAVGVIVLVGGAAATVAETKATSHAGFLMALCGGLAEICGLYVFVKSAV